MDESKNYALFSSGLKQELIQVDIGNSRVKYVASEAVGTILTDLILDPNNGTRCIFYDTPFDLQGSILFLFYLPDDSSSDRLKIALIVAPIVGGLSLLLFILLLCTIVWRRTTRSRKATSAKDTLKKHLLESGLSKLGYSDSDSNGTINIGELRFNDIIYDGSNSTVFKGEYNEQPVAIKKIKCGGFADVTERKQFIEESELVMNLNHVYILPLYGICVQQPDDRFIIMEYIASGSLDKFIQGKFLLRLRTKINVLRQICQAMIYLHSMTVPVVHGNLKPQNILLDSNMNVRIVDIHTITRTYNAMNVVNYMAPELIRDQNYTPTCDIYAFSMVMYQILFEHVPFQMKNEQCNVYTIGSEIINGRRPIVPFITNNNNQSSKNLLTSDNNTMEPRIDRKRMEQWCNEVNHHSNNKSGEYKSVIIERYVRLMTACWQSDEMSRPDFESLLQKISQMYDHMMDD
jgi:tRNA A-37 threonylcarbamoyl transferase component Bud32